MKAKAKKKTGTGSGALGATRPTIGGAGARRYEEAAVATLTHAPWNPRDAADLDPENPEMAKLVASVKAKGVIQPVAVWDAPHGARYVIAGNRRFAAAKAAGMETVPAVVFDGLTDAEAREITRVENEVRLGVSPLKDAELMKSLVERYGYAPWELAAHFGVSETTVRRRLALNALVPEIREAARGGAVAADALERMAAYPQEVQMRCAESVAKSAKREAESGGTLRWAAIKQTFTAEAYDLEDAPFDTTGCSTCANRTGAMPDLWGDAPEGLGKCLDGKCWEVLRQDALESKARELARKQSGERPPVKLVDGENAGFRKWQVENDFPAFAKKHGKGRDVAWWWDVGYDDDAKIAILWSPYDAAEYKADLAERKRVEDEKREAEAAADRERDERLRPLRDAVDAAREAIDNRVFDYAENNKIEEIAADAEKWLITPFVRVRVSAQRAALANVIAEGVTNILYDGADERATDFLAAFPEFAKEAVGVSAEEVAALRDARAALEAAEKEEEGSPAVAAASGRRGDESGEGGALGATRPTSDDGGADGDGEGE